MKNVLFLFIFSCGLLVSAFSQTHENIYVESGNNTLFMRTGSNWGSETFNPKYLNSDWEMGNLQTGDNKLITDVAFMYNVSLDRMEIRADVNPAVMGRINFVGKVFIYSGFIYNGQVRSGYFELLSEGSDVLLKRYSVQTTDAKGGALVGHDAYQNITQSLYIKKGNEPAVMVKKKKSEIIKVLSDHKKEVEAYIHENHLNMLKTKDIIRLLNYYSTLEGEE